MRVLVASTVGSGHFRPLVPWIEALEAAGHEVVVAGSSGLAAWASGWRFHDCGAPDPQVVGPMWGRLFDDDLEDPRAHVVGNIFARTNSGALLPAMAALVADFRPDLVLREPMEFASAAVAAGAGVRQVRVGISLKSFDALMSRHAGPVMEEWQPGTTAAVEASSFLTRFPGSLDPADPAADVRRYRLAQPPPRTVDPSFVYATLGTVAPSSSHLVGWFGVISEAVGELDVDTLLTVGREVDPRTVPAAPRLSVEHWADQTDVLSRAAAIVHHGGSGTTLDALAAGVPQLIVPLMADQSANAEAIAAAGAGEALHPGQGLRPVSPYDGAAERLRGLLAATLGDRSAAQRAGEIAAEMAAYDELDLAMLS